MYGQYEKKPEQTDVILITTIYPTFFLNMGTHEKRRAIENSIFLLISMYFMWGNIIYVLTLNQF